MEPFFSFLLSPPITHAETLVTWVLGLRRQKTRWWLQRIAIIRDGAASDYSCDAGVPISILIHGLLNHICRTTVTN